MKKKVIIYKNGTNNYVTLKSTLVKIAMLDECNSDDKFYDSSYFLMKDGRKINVYSVGTLDDFEKIEQPEFIYDEDGEKYITKEFFEQNKEDAILYWDGSNLKIHFIEEVEEKELEYIDSVTIQNYITKKYYKDDEGNYYCIETKNNLPVSKFYNVYFCEIEEALRND